jgi:hypothetical protein
LNESRPAKEGTEALDLHSNNGVRIPYVEFGTVSALRARMSGNGMPCHRWAATRHLFADGASLVSIGRGQGKYRQRAIKLNNQLFCPPRLPISSKPLPFLSKPFDDAHARLPRLSEGIPPQTHDIALMKMSCGINLTLRSGVPNACVPCRLELTEHRRIFAEGAIASVLPPERDVRQSTFRGLMSDDD